MATQTKVVNPASKVRNLRKGDKPYASWTDTRTGWKYKLLKSWQGNNGKVYSRWFVSVDGLFTDMGDTYVVEMWAGLAMSIDLEFDQKIWSSRDEFLKWAMGTVE
jgi:hypothetical protein